MRTLARHGGSGLRSRRLSGAQRFEARFSYGLQVFGGLLTGTLEAGIVLSDSGSTASLGWRLAPDRAGRETFRLGIEATRSERADDDEPEHRVGVELSVHW